MPPVLNMPGHLKSLELVPNQCKIFKKAFQKIATHTCGELSLCQVLFYVLSMGTNHSSWGMGIALDSDCPAPKWGSDTGGWGFPLLLYNSQLLMNIIINSM